MSVFERLRPFVSLCHACGFFPYAIENNSNTKNFERFTFSFKNLTTWWFFLISISQLAFFIGLVYLFWKQVVKFNEENMPITMSILFVINWFFVIAEFLSSRRMITLPQTTKCSRGGARSQETFRRKNGRPKSQLLCYDTINYWFYSYCHQC